MTKTTGLCMALTFLAIISSFAQNARDAHSTRNTQKIPIAESSIPAIIERNGRHALIVDGKPFLILGGQAHNSSAWPAMMPRVWKAIAYLHANTLEVPIYWEQIEARQGYYDYSILDMLISQARTHHVRLVLLWFATWKNGSNHYMPGWMKSDPVKYPNITGQDGKPVDSPSPHAEATLNADRKAFASMMKYLKQVDRFHTVIMIQVENEPGSWGSVRDYSPTAQKLFNAPVPAQLLRPDILKALNASVGSGNLPVGSGNGPMVSNGSWKEVFGDRADEYFQAWSVARYIEQVAVAGKAAYPLPMYVNVALRDPLTNPKATDYESGGATDNVIPIWKTAAPSIDLLAPDIYLSGSERIIKVMDLYDRLDNTLFVPEVGLSPDRSKYLYEVIAHGGIGFSPFGVDDNRLPRSNNHDLPVLDDSGLTETDAAMAKRLVTFAQDFEVLSPMSGQLANWCFEGKVKTVTEREDHATQLVDLGAWQAVISFGTGERDLLQTNPQTNGRLMIIQLSDDSFILIGSACHITFKTYGKNQGRPWQYLTVGEGWFAKGAFIQSRILNGDETDWGGPRFGALPGVMQVSLIAR